MDEGIDRQSPIFYQKPFQSYHSNIVTFVALRHSVTILVTSFTAPENLTEGKITLVNKTKHFYFPIFFIQNILKCKIILLRNEMKLPMLIAPKSDCLCLLQLL